MPRSLKKLYWKVSAQYAALKYPLNKSSIYVGVTGTDGKTTTCSFIYEIAKAYGYNPLLLTTVSAKFQDKNIETNLKSTSFFAYSVKTFRDNLKHFKLLNALKAIFFLDKKGFEEHSETHRTTPLAAEMRKLIREYDAKGANFFILESTSHAIDQFRVYGITFDSVSYTNITNEHLDYHGTWENYAYTKSKLITQLKRRGSAGVNRDDEKSFKLLSQVVNKQNLKNPIYGVSYGKEGNVDPANFWITIEQKKNKLIELTAHAEQKSPEDLNTEIKLFGDYNVYNALAALSCFIGLGYNNKKLKKEGWEKAVNALKNLEQVEGRMNFLSQNPTVIVDFAHTPNAMDKALSSVHEFIVNKKLQSPGLSPLLWVIFGTAGLRDRFKRAEMGKIAYDYADNILVTSEDPRTESLYEINNQIISGFKHEDEEFTIHTYFDGIKYEPEENSKFIMRFDEPNLNSRKNAIKFALENAGKDDVVIILGKGHETTMCYGDKEYAWNDIEEVKRILSELSSIS